MVRMDRFKNESVYDSAQVEVTEIRNMLSSFLATHQSSEGANRENLLSSSQTLKEYVDDSLTKLESILSNVMAKISTLETALLKCEKDCANCSVSKLNGTPENRNSANLQTTESELLLHGKTANVSDEIMTDGGCKNTKYGCCPDGMTPAGVNNDGCANLNIRGKNVPCEDSEFDCCADGFTPALGPLNFYGCKCEHFRYGCCQDNITPAKGPQFQGCECQFMHYGCCPDGITPILGDRGEGCDCESTHYGCCPDGRTAAMSPDVSGCPCNTLPYGCCPDGQTPAVTSDLRDCLCESQLYGCCLDGRTIAMGSNYEGCPCNSTPFGCCEDGETAAQGPGFEGCPCETTAYGCCADSYTPAKGPRFEGCLDVLVSKPKVSTEVCRFNKDRGPCINFSVKWYFDLRYGECSRFWYGGCDGNGNMFSTQEECQSVCVRPEGSDVCTLPAVKGPCSGTIPQWYYDQSQDECYEFSYSGCKGNANRFADKGSCQQRCKKATVTTEVSVTGTEYCFQLQDSGPCSDSEVHWHYDSKDGVCKQFYYGGCKGNRNRFKSRRECEKSCFKAQDVCTLPRVKGPCSGNFAQWYYDEYQEECFEFWFSGCRGNANRFNNKESCQQRCKKASVTTEVSLTVHDACSLPKVPGPCLGYYFSYYYDTSEKACKSFIYGGCHGNENRFENQRECEQLCVKKEVSKV